MNEQRILKTRAFALSKTATVFQAEIYAIRMAIPFIKETAKQGQKINIMCDSQVAIMALENTETRSEMVIKTKHLLNKLGEDYDITQNWIKAHVNHKGNKMADILAKTGSRLTCAEPTPISQATIKETIRQEMYREWDRRWQTQTDCRQTCIFFPCVDRAKSKKNGENEPFRPGYNG